MSKPRPSLAVRPEAGNFRLAVDRCFTLAGTGTVVTGTVFSGTVRVGDQLLLSPAGIAVRVRSIHAQNRQSGIGMTGQRCALNLAGTDFDKQDVRRGDWVLAEPAHGPTQRLDVRLQLLAGADKPLRHWSPVHFHLGAVDVMARVALLEHDKLEPGASGLAQIVLDRTIGALRGDRFIIRDQSASRTSRRRQRARSFSAGTQTPHTGTPGRACRARASHCTGSVAGHAGGHAHRDRSASFRACPATSARLNWKRCAAM